MPRPLARATAAGPVIPHDPLHLFSGHERLHGTGQAETEDQRPQRLPEHEEALAEAAPESRSTGLTARTRVTTSPIGRWRPTPRPSWRPPRPRPRSWPGARNGQGGRRASSSATAWSALVAADTCVSTSMQYWSSSTIRCRPRTWPSIRRSRLRTASLLPAYPGMRFSSRKPQPVYLWGVYRFTGSRHGTATHCVARAVVDILQPGSARETRVRLVRLTRPGWKVGPDRLRPGLGRAVWLGVHTTPKPRSNPRPR